MFSEIEIFRVLGLLFFGSGLGFLISPSYGKKAMDNLADYPIITYFSSLLSVVGGFYLITFFNVWTWDWTILIALTGWAALIKGMIILIFPGMPVSWIKELKDSYVTMKAVAASLLGFLFLALGFLL